MKHLKRICLLVAIAVAHAGFIYALYANVLQTAAPQPAPIKEIIASLLTPTPPQPETPPMPAAPPPPPKVRQPEPSKTPIPAATPVPRPAAAPSQPATPATPSPPAAASDAPATAAPATPPAPPAAPRIVTSGIEVLHLPKEYPALSRRMGEEGTVVLRIFINERGQPDPAKISVHQSSGYFRLDEAARQAATQASFRPYMESGKAVAVFALLPIKFRLDGN